MSDAPLILSLETATLGGSVWLGRGSCHLAARNGDPQVSQSNSLLSDINACLKDAGLALDDVDFFACASGPGSFTGLRIGIATLKGLAASLNRPCVGIPTLAAVAHSAGPSMATVALLPAGRGEVFTQMFSVSSVSGDVIVNPIDTAAHLSPQKLIDRYGMLPQLMWAGSGAHLQRETIESAAWERGIVFGPNSPESPSANGTPSWNLAANEENLAAHVAALALQSYSKGMLQRPEALHAIYVRPSDAELTK
ncbi:MAG: tRNA (adenosine(37)-N6)-threonylcarbamoyltransferase complex dimerization subunit type 1 TsaB [Pyrinomonadaceae bacterium]|nr:tRNA (adenosine(37)-N6)-threonylcarbamoyltransferase complex dimerization subunit type 1 TsaB [Pyrinomonadaceae bacterium]